MSEVLKIVLSLSLSGSLLIIVLFICKPLFKNRISKCWQYYIWLVVIARLLLPVTPETSLVGALFQDADRSIVQMGNLPAPEQLEIAGVPQPESDKTAVEDLAPQDGEPLRDTTPVLQAVLGYILQNLWLVWLVTALILLIRKMTIYQSFVRYVKAGRAEISNTAILDRLALIGEQAGVKTPVELYTNNLISSPLLLGFFRPCIVLPTTDVPDADFEYIILHEMTHYKRRDMFYKWLVQLVICLHWFNPLAYLMGREVSRACELACDEAVIRKLDEKGQRDYGDTLLNAIVAGGDYRDSLASMTLNESKELLKERLAAIMTFQNNRKATAILAVALAICLCGGSFMLGSYTAQPTLEIAPMEQMVFSDEGLPIMNAQNRQLYERYLKPIAVTGILYCNFSPEDISALLEDGSSGLLNLVAVLESEKMRENTQDGKLSAAFADEVLTKYFPLRAITIRDICADIYDAESDTYDYPGGLGGGPFIPIVTGSTTNGRLITLYYTAYVGDPDVDEFQYIAGTSGEIVIEVKGNDFKYLSNKVIPVENTQLNQNGKFTEVNTISSKQTSFPENTESTQASDVSFDSLTDIINISSNGQQNIMKSGSFEAEDKQLLTLTIQSDITGGTADFFLFSPNGKEQRIAIGGSDKTETVTLTEGRWAYNCTGFFDSGAVTIKGQLANGSADAKSLGKQEKYNVNIEKIDVNEVVCIGQISLDKDVSYRLDITSGSGDGLFVGLQSSKQITSLKGAAFSQSYGTTGRAINAYFNSDESEFYYVYVGNEGNTNLTEIKGVLYLAKDNSTISEQTAPPTNTKLTQANTAQNQIGNWNFFSYTYLDGYMIGIGSRAQDNLQNYSQTIQLAVDNKAYTVAFYEQAKMYTKDDKFIKALRNVIADVISQGWWANQSKGSFLIVNQVIAGKTADELYGYFCEQGDPIALQSLTPYVKKEIIEEYIVKAYEDNNEMLMMLILTELPDDFVLNADNLARRAISDGRQMMYLHLNRFVSPAVRKDLDKKMFSSSVTIPPLSPVPPMDENIYDGQQQFNWSVPSIGSNGLKSNSTDAKVLDIMQRTGNWGYIEAYLPEMTNAGIDAVVDSYNSKHPNSNEHKKASNYYN